MFQRTALKLQARERMRGFLGNAILVSLICAVLLGELGSSNFSELFEQTEQTATEGVLPTDMLPPALLGFVAVIILLVSLGGLLYHVFFGNVLAVGKYGWFMRYSRGEYPQVSQLFASLRIYKPALLTTLLRDVYVFLWSLLFIIPGVVQSYAYRLVPYIIYENPNLSAAEALRISKDIMHGNKLDLFVFDISFFFWNLLAAVTGGIVGIVYVKPYYHTAEAYVYDALKKDAVYRRGIVSPAVFGMPETPIDDDIVPPLP